MAERTYPFEDAIVTVSNVGQDRAGRYIGLVAVQTPDLVGFLAVPRNVSLFEARDWERLAADACARNGLNRAACIARGSRCEWL